jgi:ABC-type multidrug transport system ATPase subunit
MTLTAVDRLTLGVRREVYGFLGPNGAGKTTHVSWAMGKLRARDRAQLVMIAYEARLVRPGWLG